MYSIETNTGTHNTLCNTYYVIIKYNFCIIS